MSGSSQPPASSSGCGRSQWYSVPSARCRRRAARRRAGRRSRGPRRWPARARRLDPRPRDREPVRVHAQAAHQRDVLGVPVVVVAGDVAGVAVDDPAGSRVNVSQMARAPAVLGRGALDLVRRRAGAEEARQQSQGSCRGPLLLLTDRLLFRRRTRGRRRPWPDTARPGESSLTEAVPRAGLRRNSPALRVAQDHSSGPPAHGLRRAIAPETVAAARADLVGR